MTPAALKNATLERIGAVPAGGPYPADDVAKVTEKYTGLHAFLLQKNLVSWAASEDVPDKAQEAMIAVLSYACASDFQVPEPRYSRLRLEGSIGDAQPSLAERHLRQIYATKYVPHPVMTEFF